MTCRIIAVRMFLVGIATSLVVGCGGPERYRQSFDNRIMPPAAKQTQTKAPESNGVKQARAEVQLSQPAPVSPSPGEPAPPVTDGRTASGPLSLAEAVALAYRLQPRLQVFLEGVVQARGAETMAVAPFLPPATAAYSVGGFDLTAGGAPLPFAAG